ncbi:MAG: hypothetical protein DCC55_25095, partial [Chloroflexi bacterium]
MDIHDRTIAERIEQLPPEKRVLLQKLLKGADITDPGRPIVPRRRAETPLPLSFAQQRLWFLSQLEPDSPFYNVNFALHIKAPLNVAALERSINEIVRRHEALRTTFTLVHEQPSQVIAPNLYVPLPVHNLSSLSQQAREAEALRLATEEARRPFDLVRGPLIRTRLLQLDDNDYVFLLTMHHIVSDGWSMQVFARELAELYAAFA